MGMPSEIDWPAIVWRFGYRSEQEMFESFQKLDISSTCIGEFLGLDPKTIRCRMLLLGIEPKPRGYWQSNQVDRRL